MIIRYVSHGIRNPLDAVLLGLKILYDDMEKTENNWDRLETVQNIKNSCHDAVTVLDDLLTYDKLENGLSESPPMKIFRAWSFIRDTIRPFQALVRNLIL
jgi:signal transduction histidine kinase